MLESIEFNHWFWFILSLALLGLELTAPGAVFIWLAFSGIVVGGIVFVIPDMAWEMQFILFSVLGFTSVYAGRIYLKKNPTVSEDENLNDRVARYVGKKYTLERALVNGEGKIRIGDSLWLVRGDFESDVGNSVRVTGSDGVVLLVEQV